MHLLLAANLLSPDVGLVFWLAVVFGALLWILRRYAWGPITAALEEREQTITASISRAEKALERSKQLQQSNERARHEAEQEARDLLRTAREEAERVRSQKVQRTREEISQLRAQALDEIDRDKERALQSLRAEVADLAILAAEKILQENLDAQRQRGLVDSFIDGLSKN